MSESVRATLDQLGISEEHREYLGGLWADAVSGVLEPLRWIRDLPPDDADSSPRLVSPIERLNTWTQGGVYGITALGGDPGTGKSFFAMRTAWDAANSEEWDVAYIAAEMTDQQIGKRFRWIAEKTGSGPERVNELLRRRLFWWGLSGETTEIEHALQTCMWGSEKFLLVIDSMQSFLAFLGDLGPDYWKAYGRWLDRLVAVRRASEGRFAALILSELNREGMSKGRALEYKADLMLNFKNTPTPKVCKIRVVKNRERGLDGNLGEYRLNDEAWFEAVDER